MTRRWQRYLPQPRPPANGLGSIRRGADGAAASRTRGQMTDVDYSHSVFLGSSIGPINKGDYSRSRV